MENAGDNNFIIILLIVKVMVGYDDGQAAAAESTPAQRDYYPS
jgi:hypothetical protein